MRKILYLSILALGIFLVGCPQPPADNSNGAANENAAADPAKDMKASLVELETKAYEAWKNKTPEFFDTFLSDNFVGVGISGTTSKADTVKQMKEAPCDVKSFKIGDPNVVEIDANTALITTKNDTDFSCGGVAGPDQTYTASLYVKEGDNWKAAYHQNVVTAEAKIPSSPPPPPADGAAKPEEQKPAEPAADDAMLKALSESESKLWDAFAKSDSKPFDEHLSDKFMNASPAGMQDKAATLKFMSEGGCEIISHKLSDFNVTKVSETVSILTYKATQDGKCGDQALAASTWAASIWVKEGDAWKAVFHAETDVPTGKVEKKTEGAKPEEAKKPEADA